MESVQFKLSVQTRSLQGASGDLCVGRIHTRLSVPGLSEVMSLGVCVWLPVPRLVHRVLASVKPAHYA